MHNGDGKDRPRIDPQRGEEDATGEPIDRRTWLKQAGAVTGALAVGGLMPGLSGCGDDAGTSEVTDAGPDTTADTGVDTNPGDVPIPSLEPLRGDGSHPFDYIDTVVIVQMENRSFDHYFGSYTLLEGRDDIDGLTAGMFNPAGDGTEVPIMHLVDDYIISPDPSHSHSSSLDQFNNGANDGFVRNWERRLSPNDLAEKLGWPLGYYQREQLPAYYPLADAYTLCDRWFCSLLGPTWPNRFYSHAATSDGHWGNGDPLRSVTPYRYALDAGLSVGVYHQAAIYAMLTVFDPLPGEYLSEDIDAFFEDADAGRLPNITIIEPDYTFNDDHPPQDIRFGQAFVAGVYEALRQSPHWDRCLMLVFYDEHGGFFDHVPPPLAQGDERAAEGFNQLGFRVPGMVIGPLARRGHVFHDVVDHASVPALLSNLFQLDHVNERSRLAGDLSGALDLELTLDSVRPSPVVLPEIDLDFEKIRRAFDEPFGQPEMLDFARRHWGIDRESKRQELARAERLLRRLSDLRVARAR